MMSCDRNVRTLEEGEPWVEDAADVDLVDKKNNNDRLTWTWVWVFMTDFGLA